MDKQTIIQKIQDSKISLEEKQELLSIVEQSNAGPELIKKLQDTISINVEGLIEEEANMQIQAAADKFNADMTHLEDEAHEFTKDISKKADEIDAAALRNELTK